MTGNKEVKLRYSVRGKKSKFFESEGVDELVAISMAIAQELWVVKEELASYKALISKKQKITENEIKNFKLSPTQRKELDAENQRYIDRVFFILREKAESTGSDPEEPSPPKVP
tara:strand:+ start:2813 stop:3154 length:342 start_codon:yes stop_codon:yes gene_type:complete